MPYETSSCACDGSGYAGFMIDAVGLTAMLLTSTVCCVAASAGMLLLCRLRSSAA